MTGLLIDLLGAPAPQVRMPCTGSLTFASRTSPARDLGSASVLPKKTLTII